MASATYIEGNPDPPGKLPQQTKKGLFPSAGPECVDFTLSLINMGNPAFAQGSADSFLFSIRITSKDFHIVKGADFTCRGGPSDDGACYSVHPP